MTWGGGAGSGRACALGRSGGGGGARTLVPGQLLLLLAVDAGVSGVDAPSWLRGPGDPLGRDLIYYSL